MKSYQGTYKKSASVNGKPSWKSQTKAIWYNKGRSIDYKWIIGNQNDIGTPRGFIYRKGMSSWSQHGVWHNGKIWKRLDPIDFSIECNKYNRASTSEGNLHHMSFHQERPLKNP